MTETSARASVVAQTRTSETPAGQIVGRVEGDVVRVLGVPYAVAGRFEAPQPAPPFWGADGEPTPYLAFRRAPASPQPVSSRVLDALIQGANDGMTFSEHCQALTITVPADLAPGERLPVMVWIHGGGGDTGAGDLDIYDPRALVVEQRVIVVAVTYRLGLLGFFGDGDTVPANLGLLDLIAAVRWVHENIEAFGGAADSVTLFGQSSGGDAIAHLMISEGAAGLFRRAIVQSAPLGINGGRSRMVRAMADAVGTPPRDAPVAEVLALQAVAERAARRFGLRGGMAFGAQYGQAPLPAENARDDAWRAVAPDVDLLIGSTVDETGLYIPVLPLVHRMTRLPAIGRLLRWLIVRPTTHLTFTRNAHRFAARHRAAGGRAVAYELVWAPGGGLVGAAHTSDVPLLLGSRRAWVRTSLVGARNWDETHARGLAVRRLWADFARTGTVAEGADTGPAPTMTFDRG